LKDAFYFSHDSNARSDLKIQALRSKYGVKGYGMYWIIIEMMRESKDHTLPHNQNFAYYGFANEFGCSPEEAKCFIQDCIYEFALFICDEQCFWSDSLNRRMDKYKQKSATKAENGMKGGRPRKEQQEKAPEATSQPEPELDKPKKEKPVRTKNATVAHYSVEVNQLTDLLVEKIKENNPKAQTPNFNQWRDSIRLMMEIDGYEFMQIRKMIEWCQSDDFWKSNILSAKKLREKAGTLILQMDRGGESGRVKTNSKRPIIEVAKFEGYNENIISDERMEEIRIKARQYEESRMRALP
jgi:hypothetical protein